MPAASVEGTLHVDRYLTNYSVGYIQNAVNFVAQRATSAIPVQNQSDKYVVYERGYFWRDEVKERPLGGTPEQTSYKVSEGSYIAREYALEHVIDDRLRANTDQPINLDENATKLLSQKHMIKQDRYFATNFFTASKWTMEASGVTSGAVEGTSFLQFNDATSDPIQEIDYWKDRMHRSTGFMPNVLVLGAGVKRVLRTHPDIADRIKYTQTGIADEALLARLFEIPTVLVARSIFNAADEGATDDFQYIANEKAALLLYIEATPALDSPTAIATFGWERLIPGSANRLGGVIERGRLPRNHSDFFQGRMAWDMKQVAADLGVFLDGVIA